MNYVYRFCFVLFTVFSAGHLLAAPGDTTVVQSHTATQLANFGNYDHPAAFPAGTTTYQKINMTFTLGKYQCPGNPQYCGDWDYTVLIYLMAPTGDTLEIGRLITPYANVSRFPWNWKHRYVFDVTDYASVLKNNANIRILYSGYSGGFTANVKFDFIEGTPPRNVVGIERAWHGYFNYGNIATLETKLNDRTFNMPANATSAALKLYLTGHGGNAGDNCAEFCQKYYRLRLNNNQIHQQTIWKSDCGSNNLYPQTGTWLYDRANWCPGEMVTPYQHFLSPLTPGNPFNLNIDFEQYTNNNSQAGWQLEGQIIYYGAYNNPVDASLVNIISPSNHEAFYRDNQVCQEPKIEVKNTGNAALTSLNIQYGLLNGTMHSYLWQGNLSAGNKAVIILPTVPEIQSVTSSNVKFVTRILQANGSPDGNALNNELVSTFTPLPVWPNNLVLTFTTNRASFAGFNETSWKLTDAAGNIVRQRVNNPNQSTLRDTVSLPQGCYRLEMEDKGCDGISWWAYQFYQPNPGTGSLVVRQNGSPAFLPMRGYFGGDFGCGFSQTFYVATPLGLQETNSRFDLLVYPNPATDQLQVQLKSTVPVSGQLVLLNPLGQIVYQARITDPEVTIPVKDLANGVYTLQFLSGSGQVTRKVVIAH